MFCRIGILIHQSKLIYIEILCVFYVSTCNDIPWISFNIFFWSLFFLNYFQILERQKSLPVKNGEEVKDDELQSSKSSFLTTPVSLTPKSPTTPAAQYVPFAPPSSPNGMFAPPHNLHYVSAVATLPRSKCRSPSIKSPEEIYSQVPKREIRISTSDIQKNHEYDDWPTSPLDRDPPPLPPASETPTSSRVSSSQESLQNPLMNGKSNCNSLFIYFYLLNLKYTGNVI